MIRRAVVKVTFSRFNPENHGYTIWLVAEKGAWIVDICTLDAYVKPFKCIYVLRMVVFNMLEKAKYGE